MAKKKIVAKPQIKEDYVPPDTKWYWYIRKKGFLQPVPYKYKIPDLKKLKEYADRKENDIS